MSGLLEVVAWHAADAERAEAGGADRVHLLAGTEDDPRSPEPALVGQVRRATSLPIRVMLRLREGFGTDGGELARLQGLIGGVPRGRRGRCGAGVPERPYRDRRPGGARAGR